MSEYKITVHKMRNVFKPRWWQLRRRYHIWKANRHREKMLSKMSPEGRAMLSDLEKEIERKILFGDEANISREKHGL
jgi:hypothetical protein